MRRFRLLAMAAILCIGCGGKGDEDPTVCGVTAPITIVVKSSPLASDGSVIVYGTTLFAPVVQAVDAGATASRSLRNERAIHDLYVAGARVTQHDFNFRSWTVLVEANRVCAFSDGEGQALLPVRVYLAGPSGVCAYDLQQEDALRVAVSTEMCSGVADGGAAD